MENIDGRVIMLILFVVISGVKWLVEQSKSRHGGDEDISESLEDIYEEFREDIRERQTATPTSTSSGPPPVPRATSQRATASQAETSKQRDYRPFSAEDVTQPFKANPVKKPKLSAKEKEALANFQQNASFPKSPEINRSKSKGRQRGPHPSVRQLLSHPSSVRQAVILTEILGPPRSIQS